MTSLSINKDEAKLLRREKIFDFEDKLSQVEGAFKGDNELCPLKHSFAPGIYVREIRIPAGTWITGKIHKHSHPNFLMSGTVDVFTESNGTERLVGPMVMISPAGTKRALYAVTDLHWCTVHFNPSNTEDLKKLEDEIIVKNYKEYEFYKSKKNTLIDKLKSFLISILI